MSPISATKPTAVSVSMPRRQRSRATVGGLSDVLCEVGVTDSALGAGKGALVLPEDEVR